MKNESERLWQLMKEEADRLEKQAENITMEVPGDAKSSQELYEELMEKLSECEQ